MPPIYGPQDGSVAVTGASGYIGSHVVKNLLEHGYTVHCCVRDASRADKVDFLKAMSADRVHLFQADLTDATNGSYDAAFAGCSCVFHVAADLGSDTSYGEVTPQRQYDSLLAATQGVLASCAKAGTIKRVIYTSSFAAVMGPAADGYEFSEDDFAGPGGWDSPGR